MSFAVEQQSSDCSFSDILARYASNHNETGTDKTTSHSYGELYSSLFAPLRSRAERVMEIGVYSGASVLALADFFTGAQVDGIDITLDRVLFGRDHPRISFRKIDGTSSDAPRLLLQGCSKAAAGEWDLILDDASHRPDHQLRSFELFGGFVREGGLYVIEDIDGGQVQLQEQLRKAAERMNFKSFEWHDLRHVRNQFDDIVAVMRR